MMTTSLKRVLIFGGQVVLIVVVITAAVFIFGGYHENEFDRLPTAQRQIEGDWLKNDWYLNLEIKTYQLFNLLVGPLVTFWGFQWGAILGRLLTYLLFALALNLLFKTLGLRFSLGLAVVFVYLNLRPSLIAKEWFVGD